MRFGIHRDIDFALVRVHVAVESDDRLAVLGLVLAEIDQLIDSAHHLRLQIRHDGVDGVAHLLLAGDDAGDAPVQLGDIDLFASVALLDPGGD